MSGTELLIMMAVVIIGTILVAPESLRVTFPAACGVKCSRQRARRLAHRCTRTAHRLFSEYPAPWGGDPLFPSGRIPRRLRRSLLAQRAWHLDHQQCVVAHLSEYP